MINAPSYLAHRYARAFLNLYFNKLKAEDRERFKKAQTFFNGRKKALFLMRLSLLDDAIKRTALLTLCQELELPDVCQKLLNLLVEDKRSLLFGSVFGALQTQINERLNATVCHVSYVGALTQSDKQSITSFLEQATGKTVLCHYRLDQTLIGGVRLQTDNLLWEDSVRNSLNRIACLAKQ